MGSYKREGTVAVEDAFGTEIALGVLVEELENVPWKRRKFNSKMKSVWNMLKSQ